MTRLQQYTFTYISKHKTTGQYITGIFKARHSFEALSHARFYSQMNGGDVRNTYIMRGEHTLKELTN